MKNFNQGGFKRQGFGGGKNFGGRSEMHPATCSGCGERCEVPFKPAPGKAVYCNQCFKKDDFAEPRFGGKRNDDRNFNRRDFGEKRMHPATCADCGNRCEVPFKPTGEKPIYCQNCFGGNREKGRDMDFSLKAPNPMEEKLEQLNKKLDKILKALEVAGMKKTFIVEKPATEKTSAEPEGAKPMEAEPGIKKEKVAKKTAKKKTSKKK